MSWSNVVLIVLSSAAVGALVSSLLTLMGSALERRARRRELLLSKAIELAFNRTQTAMTAAEKMGSKFVLHDNASLAATYFKELETLLNTGDLSAKFRETERLSEETVKRQREEAG
jgi:hypothetical protein